MTALKEQVPKSLRMPVSILSYLIGVTGATVGWILLSLGATLYFDLQGLGDKITSVEALTVLFTGIVVAVIGYLGLKGFMYFSY